MGTVSVERSGPFELRRRGECYELLEDGILLLGTYGGDSERALVAAALEAAAEPGRVLLGGIGVGYALGAALADPRVAAVTVAEPHGALVQWNRTHLAACSGNGLADPRTTLHPGSPADLAGPFDAICLEASEELSGQLPSLRRALAPGGALAVWSAGAEPELAAALARLFGQVQTRHVAQGAAEPDSLYIVRC